MGQEPGRDKDEKEEDNDEDEDYQEKDAEEDEASKREPPSTDVADAELQGTAWDKEGHVQGEETCPWSADPRNKCGTYYFDWAKVAHLEVAPALTSSADAAGVFSGSPWKKRQTGRDQPWPANERRFHTGGGSSSRMRADAPVFLAFLTGALVRRLTQSAELKTGMPGIIHRARIWLRTSWIGSKLAARAASDSCLLKLLGDLPTGRDCLSLSGDKGSCQELQLSGERLHFRKIEGDGPDAGWVSTRHSLAILLLVLFTNHS
ncbi:hypothetical protein AK812_SmicGene28520 [Symbiodinium microadriaticum]|uniref:Uncharacterized protein n=1 Tax=Symbiodinium microadriaticum TaxID=2951 RepID=A0A1Q9D467_SYMMI|nr:hypothetical protein AK812_SmicGene28520 [Symbiodinium microadriaticum]